MATELGAAYVTITATTKGLAKEITSALLGIDVSASGEAQGSSLASGISAGLSKAKSAIGNAIKSAADVGISQIASHLDQAISRVDTLEGFPDLLESMGETSESAAQATEKLSSGVQGLPTSLDSIVDSAQSLYFTLGDLDTATDVALAMNDAFITFGASTTDASNAMDMMNTMISNGTYDSARWRSVNSAAPGLLDQIAEGLLGDEANMSTLRDALNDGTLSTEDFLEGMVSLDQEGTDSMTAFSDSAQTASGGIQTSMDNVDIAITRGIGDVIEALDTDAITSFIDGIADAIDDVSGMIVDFLKQCEQTGAIDAFWEALNKLWDIGGKIFNILGDVIGKILGVEDPANDAKGVMDGLNGVLDAVADALDWVDENLDWLIPLLEGAVAGFVGLKASLGIQSLISGVSQALGIATTATEGATGATRGLNSAMDANPIFGIISLIIMLVSYIVELWMTNEDFRDAVMTIFGAIGDFIGGIVDGIVWFFTEAIPGAIEFVVSGFQDMWDKVCTFFGWIGDFVSNIVNAIVGFFTETIPGAIDTVIQWFASIPENVMNFLGELWDNICNVFNSIWEFISGIFEGIGTTISDAFWGFIDFIAGIGWDIWNAVSGAFQDAIDFILSLPEQALQWGSDIIQGIIDGITGMITGIGDAVGNIASTIASFLGFSVPEVGPLSDFDTYMPDMMELMQEGIEEGVPQVEAAANEAANSIATSMSDAFNFMVNDADNAFNGVVDVITENLNVLHDDSLGIIDETSKGITEDFVDMDTTISEDVEGMVESVKESLNDLSNYLNSSTLDVSEWQSDLSHSFDQTALDLHETITSTLTDMETQSMDTLSTMSGEVNNELLSMSTSAAGIISDLQNSSDNSFKSLAANAVSSVQDMSNAVNAQLAGTESAMSDFENYAETWGENLGNDIAKGITNAKDSVKEAVTEIANEVDSVLGFSEPETGPLSDFDQSMPDMIDMMVEGIEANLEQIEKAAEILGALLITGMLSQQNSLVAQLQTFFDALNASAYEWGSDFMDSLAAGMQDGISEVLSCITTLFAATRALTQSGLKNEFDLIGDYGSRNLSGYSEQGVVNNYYSFEGITLQGQDAEDARAFATRLVELMGA